jgi:hypothetical protein
MTEKDGWFLGLLAVAFLVLEAASTTPMSDDARTPSPAPGEDPADRSRLLPVPVSRALPVRVIPRDVCPRNPLHAVALRADGAMWCRGCDEAFYPQAAIWTSVMSAVAA